MENCYHLSMAASSRACQALALAAKPRGTFGDSGVLSQRELLSALNHDEGFREALREDERLRGLLKPKSFAALFAEIEGFSRAPKGSITMEGLAAFLDAHVLDDLEESKPKQDTDLRTETERVKVPGENKPFICKNPHPHECKHQPAESSGSLTSTSEPSSTGECKSQIDLVRIKRQDSLRPSDMENKKTQETQSVNEEITGRHRPSSNVTESPKHAPSKGTSQRKQKGLNDTQSLSANQERKHSFSIKQITTKDTATDTSSLSGEEVFEKNRNAKPSLSDDARIMALARTESEARLLQKVRGDGQSKNGLSKDDLAYIDSIEQEQRERSAATKLFMDNFEGSIPGCSRYLNCIYPQQRVAVDHLCQGQKCDRCRLHNMTSSSPNLLSGTKGVSATSTSVNSNRAHGRHLEKLSVTDMSSTSSSSSSLPAMSLGTRSYHPWKGYNLGGGTVSEIASICQTNAYQWLDQVLVDGVHDESSCQHHVQLGRMHVQVLAQCVGDLLRELDQTKSHLTRAREDANQTKRKAAAAESQRRAEIDALRVSNQQVKSDALRALHALRNAVRATNL